MSIHTTKDGRHFCQYYIEGKQKRKFFGHGLAARSQAEKYDLGLKNAGAIKPYNFQDPLDKSVLFESLAVEYLTIKRKTDLAQSTVDALNYKLSKIILPEIGHLQAPGITHKRLDQYVLKRLSTARTVMAGTKEKPENITRIIIVGSSNTYGFEVSDNETYPFQLENYLNENYQGNYEVWNAGISSYMLSQELELSKRVIKNYNPDILIIQLANEGRRFFLEDYDTTVFLNNNKELFHENIPLLISGNNFFRSIHHFFIEYSGMYRIISMKINQLIVKINLEDNCENITCLKQKYYVRYYYYGDYVSQKKLNDFLSEDYDFEIIFFDPVFVTTFNIDLTKKNIHYFYLNSSNKPEEYMLLHPPSHVYAYYVNQLGNYLETNNLIEK